MVLCSAIARTAVNINNILVPGGECNAPNGGKPPGLRVRVTNKQIWAPLEAGR